MGAPAPAEIRALATMIDELDYYQLLEITPGATSSDVKRAYHASSRRFHPDANRHLDAELRGELERIARRLAEAYCVVRDPLRRRAYDRHLASTTRVPRLQLSEAAVHAEKKAREEHAGSTPKGRRFYLQAEADIQRGDLAAASRNLQMALTFEPGNPRFEQKLEQVREQLRH